MAAAGYAADSSDCRADRQADQYDTKTSYLAERASADYGKTNYLTERASRGAPFRDTDRDRADTGQAARCDHADSRCFRRAER